MIVLFLNKTPPIFSITLHGKVSTSLIPRWDVPLHTLQYHSRPPHPFTSSLCAFILTLASALTSLLLLPQVDKRKVHFHCHSLAVPWAPQGGESENKQEP